MSRAQPPRRRFIRRPLIAALIAAGLAGCAPQVDTRGNLPDPETVLEVQPGIHDRNQVSSILGTPSTVATFEDDTWYYISRRTEQVAFFDPEVVDQQVLMVKFGQDGLVSDMQIYGLEDGEIINPVDRTTPTSGREITILQQLFGNLGRFNTADQQ
jgi:outer membrane protein assembly factor BamE (lipoprotein component of BamABCDE complex)